MATIRENAMSVHSAIKRVLNREEATEILAESRTKGEYEEAITTFFNSGELYCDFTAIFPKKEEANLKNNLKKYAKMQKIPWQVVTMQNGDGTDHVILVNLDAHRLAMQANEA